MSEFSLGAGDTDSDLVDGNGTKDAFAIGCDIRAEMPLDVTRRVLLGHKFTIRLPGLPCLRRTRIGLGDAAVSRTLRALAFLSIIWIPFQFAMEPFCQPAAERRSLARGKAMHLCASALYLLLCSGEAVALRTNSDVSAKGQRLTQFQNTLLFRIPVELLAFVSFIGECAHVSVETVSLDPSPAQMAIAIGLVKFWRWLAPTAGSKEMSFFIQLLDLFFSLIIFAHVGACGCALLAVRGMRQGKATWADATWGADGSDLYSCYNFYASAIYFSSYTVTSIGYGDITAANPEEMATLAIFMIVSQMYVAKIFADLTFATSTHNYWRVEHHQAVTRTTTALQSMGVPRVLQQRVLAYQDFSWTVQKKRQVQDCLRELSQPLREELQLARYHRFLKEAPFLRALPIKLLRPLISTVTEQFFLPADFIMRRGDTGSEFYFLMGGSAAVFLTVQAPQWRDTEVRCLSPGDYFGEVAVLTGSPRTSWVMARQYCVCSVLPKHAIDDLMEAQPSCVVSLVKSMQQALNLEPTITWKEIALRLHATFPCVLQAQDFACSGGPVNMVDGEEEIVTWAQYKRLLTKLRVNFLDQRLLWVGVDIEEAGFVTFTELMTVIHEGSRLFSAGKKNQDAALFWEEWADASEELRAFSSPTPSEYHRRGLVAASARTSVSVNQEQQQQLRRLQTQMETLGERLESLPTWMDAISAQLGINSAVVASASKGLAVQARSAQSQQESRRSSGVSQRSPSTVSRASVPASSGHAGGDPNPMPHVPSAYQDPRPLSPDSDRATLGPRNVNDNWVIEAQEKADCDDAE